MIRRNVGVGNVKEGGRGGGLGYMLVDRICTCDVHAVQGAQADALAGMA